MNVLRMINVMSTIHQPVLSCPSYNLKVEDKMEDELLNVRRDNMKVFSKSTVAYTMHVNIFIHPEIHFRKECTVEDNSVKFSKDKRNNYVYHSIRQLT